MENNIRSLRRQRGWTMAQLAERVEGQPHFTTIAKLERNVRGLSGDWIGKIAKALGVAPEEIISTSTKRPRFVPLLGTIPAGSLREAIQDPLDYVMAPQGGPNVFALYPEGTSMNRLIPAGAYVLIDPDQLDLTEGKIYAVRNEGGEATLKLYRASPPRLEPCSSDQSHQPIYFGHERFDIIGRVVWQGQEM